MCSAFTHWTHYILPKDLKRFKVTNVIIEEISNGANTFSGHSKYCIRKVNPPKDQIFPRLRF